MEAIYVRTPDDMLDVIEGVSGYTPDGILTAIVDGEGWHPHVLGLQIGTDEGVARAARALDGRAVYGIVLWGEAENALATKVATHIALYRPDVPIIRATKDQWWWFDEILRHRRRPSHAKASMVYLGIDAVVAPNRDAMISGKLLPEPRWGEVVEAFPPVRPRDAGDWLVEVLTSDEPLSRELTAQVIGALRAPAVGDDLVEGLCLLRVAQQGMRLNTIRTRLVEVAAEARDGSRGRIYRPISLACYLLGNGELALAAVDLADADDPGNTLTTILREAFSSDLSPDILAQTVADGMAKLRAEEQEGSKK